MEKYILIQEFGTQSEVEQKRRKKCEKSLVLVNIASTLNFYVHFFLKVSAKTLTNERKKQDFFKRKSIGTTVIIIKFMVLDKKVQEKFDVKI
jgi:predicted ATP-binding protein involved in virulence